MKLLLFIHILIHSAIITRAQTSKIVYGDTTFWYNVHQEKMQRLSLPPLHTSTDSFHFRFCSDRQVVEVWSTDGIAYHGRILNYINSLSPNDQANGSIQKRKIHVNEIIFDSTDINGVLALAKRVSPISFQNPRGKWEVGVDGASYIFEYATPTKYSFNNYWEPGAQKNQLVEAKLVDSIINTLDTLLQLERKYSIFFTSLKPGSYIWDGPEVISKLGKQQYKKYQKGRVHYDYLDSIKTNLNKYLSDTLTKMIRKDGPIECSGQFFLKFSKRNKLVKVTTNLTFYDKEDLTDFKNCRKRIISAIKFVELNFVHSRVHYWKQLTFYDGKVDVY